ncbi:MAG TPA: tetratricopeptide repeat protein [Longimicrobiales bacterium]
MSTPAVTLLQQAQALQAARDYPGLAALLSPLPRAELLAQPELGLLLAEAWRRAGERVLSLELARELEPVLKRRGNDRLFRERCNLEGILLFESGDLAEAEAEWRRLLDASSRASDDEFVARANQNLGIIYTLAGRREEALASHERAIVAYQRLGYLRGLAQAHNNLAISYREMGFGDEADNAFREALAFARTDGSEDELGRIEQEWALLTAMRGDGPLAALTAERSLRRFRKLGEPAGAGDSLRVLGIVALWEGQLERSFERLQEALRLARELHLRLLEAETLEACAALAQARGDDGAAAALRDEGARIFTELGAREWGIQIRAQLAARAPVRPA